jgi:outer membrane protein
MDAITSIGQTGGYVYIMQTGSALYISSTLSTDVTAEVKKKLGL